MNQLSQIQANSSIRKMERKEATPKLGNALSVLLRMTPLESRTENLRRITWRRRAYKASGSSSNDRSFTSDHISAHCHGRVPQTDTSERFISPKCGNRIFKERSDGLDIAPCGKQRHQNAQITKQLDPFRNGRYGSHVAANSAAGRRNPFKSRRAGAPFRLQALFLCLQSSVMVAVCGQASAWPVSLITGIPTPRTAATQSRRKDRGSSSNQGATPMHAFNPSKIRAAAHRAMALAALRADSSLSSRLARYRRHIEIARSLEAQEVASV